MVFSEDPINSRDSALLARSAGHEVLGADAGVYPPMSSVLAAAGIELHEENDWVW